MEDDKTQQIEKKVRRIIAEKLALEEQTVTKEANVKEDLGADELDIEEIMMQLEDEFDIVIEEEGNRTTVSDIIHYIEQKAGG